MHITELLEPGTNLDNLLTALEDFLPVVIEELELSSLPKIVPVLHIEGSDQPTFGQFNFVDNIIYVAINYRHIIDILRTLAHELVHYSQNVAGQLSAENGETGSEIENEANFKAGIIMRKFGKMFPNYFQNQPVTVNEVKRTRGTKRRRAKKRAKISGVYGAWGPYGINTGGESGGDGGE